MRSSSPKSSTSTHVDELLAQVEEELERQRAQQEAEERARKEAEERAKREAEERARLEEERKQREAEERARLEEERRQREEEQRHHEEAQRRLQEEERMRQRLEEERRAYEEEMRRIQEETEARVRAELVEQMTQEPALLSQQLAGQEDQRLAEKAALQRAYLEAIWTAEKRGRQRAEEELRLEYEEKLRQAKEGLQDVSLELDSKQAIQQDLLKDEAHAQASKAAKQEDEEQESSSLSNEIRGDEADEVCLKPSDNADDSANFLDDEGVQNIAVLLAPPTSAEAQMSAALRKASHRYSAAQLALSEALLFKDEDPRKQHRKQLVRTLTDTGKMQAVGDKAQISGGAQLADESFELPTTTGSASPEKIETMKRTQEAVELREDGEVESSVSATSSFKMTRKKMPRHIKLMAVTGVALLVLAVSAITLWSCTHKSLFFADQEGNKPAAGTVVSFEVKTDSGWKLVAMDLKAQGLIDDTSDFIEAVKSQGLEQQLKPGVFNLTVGQTPDEIAQILSHESNSLLHIPEGLTVKQTAEAVAKKSSITVDDFMNQAKASLYVNDFPFLKDAYNDSLEGYLFPKSYNLPPDATADTVIRMMLKQYAEETKGLSSEAADSRGLTHNDVVIIASLIERETARDDERARIASVIYNRLDIKMKLQLCPTVIYALGGKTDPLTYDDLKVDSPYNTYKIDGLPPGPICSPSLKSLRAAADPETTDYLFYVSKGDGTHLFTKDYSQFEEGKAEYWNMQGRQ